MILLDTHVLLWLAGSPDRLSRRAASAIRRARTGGGLAIASITLWEIAQLAVRGRIRFGGSVERFLLDLIAATGVTVCDLTPEIAAQAAQFQADIPADSADRLIVATACAMLNPLVTADERLRSCHVLKTIW